MKIPATGGGEPEDAFTSERDMWGPITLQISRKGLYYTEYERRQRGMVVSFYDFADKKSTTVFRLEKANWGSGGSYSVSPDGKSILYARVDQSQTNLILIDNFR